MSTVYLTHFNQAYRHARHYLGFVESDLDARLERHKSGHGARLMQVVAEAEISWQCVRTWQGDRKLERWLKRKKAAPTLCPVCAGAAANNRANFKKVVK